jgi:hypothetical protein
MPRRLQVRELSEKEREIMQETAANGGGARGGTCPDHPSIQ